MVSIRSHNTLPLVLAFVLLAASVMGALWLSVQQQTAVYWVHHTLEMQNKLDRVQQLAAGAETGQRGYLLSGQTTYLEPYHDAVKRLPALLDEVQAASLDNAHQQVTIVRLRSAVMAKLDELATTVTLMRIGRSADAIRIMRGGSGRSYMLTISAAVNRMAAEENRLLSERSRTAARTTALAEAMLIVGAILTVVVAGWTFRESRRRFRDLKLVNTRLIEEINERDIAQAQVRQLQKMETIGQLTGGIAHDFNNMLAIVLGSLDIARRRLTGNEHPTVVRCIDNATEGAQRAATLTARLLAFSRQQPLEPKVVDANKLVGGMSELLRRTIGEAVRVETVLAGGLWRICADAAQIESAIVNLAVNGRDAMPDGGRLTIETSNTELDDRYARQHEEVTAGQYVMISVSDTGTGMPPEVIERAFDPFYTTKGVGKGTGLGLSQVFGFIKQSAGHVKIYSEIGQGTTIKIYLPRYTGDEIEAQAYHADQDVPRGTRDEIILVVEDEEQVRHMSVDALRELGYTVIQAADGAQALAQLAMQPHIDLLFTDIIMPEMTGRELADRAILQMPRLKVLYTTGYTRNSIVHNGIVDHDIAFLAKPFSIQALAQKVRLVLDS